MEKYPSDLTDQEWEIIKPFVEYRGGRVGRPRIINTRDVVDAIFFVTKTGCQWRQLPKKYPHWKRVHRYLLRWREKGIWQKINNCLQEKFQESEKSIKQPQHLTSTVEC